MDGFFEKSMLGELRFVNRGTIYVMRIRDLIIDYSPPKKAQSHSADDGESYAWSTFYA